jgi:hypothetical protein
MFVIIHALFGGLIGEYFHSVLFVVLFSLMSHFFLDMIPHWDGGGFDKKIFNKTGMAFVSKLNIFLHVIDMAICLVLISFLYKEYHSKLMVLGAFAGIIPDIAKIGYATKLKRNRHYMGYLKFHSRIQREVNWRLGLAVQGILTLILIVALF